jgi:hypothetical protein
MELVSRDTPQNKNVRVGGEINYSQDISQNIYQKIFGSKFYSMLVNEFEKISGNDINTLLENKYFARILAFGELFNKPLIKSEICMKNMKVLAECLKQSRILGSYKKRLYVDDALELLETLSDPLELANASFCFSKAIAQDDPFLLQKQLQVCLSIIENAKDKSKYNKLIYRCVKFISKNKDSAYHLTKFLDSTDPLKIKSLCKIINGFRSTKLSKQCYADIKEIFFKNLKLCERYVPKVIRVLNWVKLKDPVLEGESLVARMRRIHRFAEQKNRHIDTIFFEIEKGYTTLELQNTKQELITSCNLYQFYMDQNNFTKAQSELVNISKILGIYESIKEKEISATSQSTESDLNSKTVLCHTDKISSSPPYSSEIKSVINSSVSGDFSGNCGKSDASDFKNDLGFDENCGNSGDILFNGIHISEGKPSLDLNYKNSDGTYVIEKLNSHLTGKAKICFSNIVAGHFLISQPALSQNYLNTALNLISSKYSNQRLTSMYIINQTCKIYKNSIKLMNLSKANSNNVLAMYNNYSSSLDNENKPIVKKRSKKETRIKQEASKNKQSVEKQGKQEKTVMKESAIIKANCLDFSNRVSECKNQQAHDLSKIFGLGVHLLESRPDPVTKILKLSELLVLNASVRD